MHSGRRRSPGLCCTRVLPSLTYRQNLLSLLKTTERYFTLQSTLSRHQSSSASWCCGVSGSLVRSTRDLSPAASRQFSMVLGDTASAICAQISSPSVFGQPLLLAQCVDLDMCLYYSAIQNLVYRCGNVPQTTAESSDTPPIHCAQHV